MAKMTTPRTTPPGNQPISYTCGKLAIASDALADTQVNNHSPPEAGKYLRHLLDEQEGAKKPTDEDLRRFDQERRDKRVPNDEWISKSAPNSQMKDQRTPRLSGCC
jgi:hypothetical protein